MTTTDSAPTSLPQSAAPAEFVQTLRGASRWREAVFSTATGEASATPGLVIVPRMEDMDQSGWQFRGDWHVVHQASGLRVPPAAPGMGLGHARDIAVLLGDTGLDWTQPAEALTDLGLSNAVCLELFDRALNAVSEGQPLRMRASSWKQFPPLYSLLEITPHGSGVDEEYKFLTYAAAVEFVLDCQQTGLAVFRDPMPAWGLRCAWLDCQDPLVDGEYELPIRDDDRDALVGEAAMQQWRQLDARRWLCPPCNRLFPACPSY